MILENTTVFQVRKKKTLNRYGETCLSKEVTYTINQRVRMTQRVKPMSVRVKTVRTTPFPQLRRSVLAITKSKRDWCSRTGEGREEKERRRKGKGS